MISSQYSGFRIRNSAGTDLCLCPIIEFHPHPLYYTQDGLDHLPRRKGHYDLLDKIIVQTVPLIGTQNKTSLLAFWRIGYARIDCY